MPVPRSLRDWMNVVESRNGIQHIEASVDPHLEMGALTYMAHQRPGAPALLFTAEGSNGTPVRHLWNMFGTSWERIAAAFGEDLELTPLELVRAVKARYGETISPTYVDDEDAPIFEVSEYDDDIDLRGYPFPTHWPRDGGPYAGTADAVITRDPNTGQINVGTYRMMVHDDRHVGLYLSPGKDALLHIQAAWDRGEPLEVVAVWGAPPLAFVVGSQSFPKNASELDYMGGLLGAPAELVNARKVDLPILAHAEFAIEGIIRPGSVRPEGPFGEFTGYYGRPEDSAPAIEVVAVHRRRDPILTNALMADYPACESGCLYAIARSAKIWEDLDKLGIPGIRGVYCHPAGAAGAAMTVVSLEQRYAGHAAQVLALAAQAPGGAYFSKLIVVVDHDVDPTSLGQVIWAISTRCSPVDDIDILRSTWSTYLDPTLNPPEIRPWGSKALVNACMDYRHYNDFSPRTSVAKSTYELVTSRWSEYGMEGDPPVLWNLEADM